MNWEIATSANQCIFFKMEISQSMFSKVLKNGYFDSTACAIMTSTDNAQRKTPFLKE